MSVDRVDGVAAMASTRASARHAVDAAWRRATLPTFVSRATPSTSLVSDATTPSTQGMVKTKEKLVIIAEDVVGEALSVSGQQDARRAGHLRHEGPRLRREKERFAPGHRHRHGRHLRRARSRCELRNSNPGNARHVRAHGHRQGRNDHRHRRQAGRGHGEAHPADPHRGREHGLAVRQRKSRGARRCLRWRHRAHQSRRGDGDGAEGQEAAV